MVSQRNLSDIVFWSPDFANDHLYHVLDSRLRFLDLPQYQRRVLRILGLIPAVIFVGEEEGRSSHAVRSIWQFSYHRGGHPADSRDTLFGGCPGPDHHLLRGRPRLGRGEAHGAAGLRQAVPPQPQGPRGRGRRGQHDVRRKRHELHQQDGRRHQRRGGRRGGAERRRSRGEGRGGCGLTEDVGHVARSTGRAESTAAWRR
mmetsp:Transcript_32107/g.84245  ORF Transcript_32107/g.84245 Transcript_32107/m.84245 type:complete len:201 (-) Transcript_32107:103-705(-)